MNAEQHPKRSLVGVEFVRLLASEGDRIFSTDRALFVKDLQQPPGSLYRDTLEGP